MKNRRTEFFVSTDAAPIDVDAVSSGDPFQEAAVWFARLTDGSGTEDERRAHEAWLARDPRHAEAYAEVQALWGEMGQAARLDRTGRPDPTVSPYMAAQARPGASWRRVAGGVIAASLLIVAGLGLSSTGAFNTMTADHGTAVGERMTATLSDGSRITLGTNTRLNVEFTAGLRRVHLLSGEAFFEVEGDQDRSFEVVAGGGTTRALGTAFNVRLTGDAVSVALMEGRLRVSQAVAGGNLRKTTLRPGEAAEYGPGQALSKVRRDVSALTAWRDGDLVFVNRTLEDVVAELDRHRPGKIVLMAGGLATARFTGVIKLGQADRAFRGLKAALPIDIVQATPYLTLIRAR